MTTPHDNSTPQRGTYLRSAGFSLIAAVTAAGAAYMSSALALSVSAMFIGWVAYFTRGLSVRDGAANLACLMLGVGFGMFAALALAELRPLLGMGAIAGVVFAVALVVVSLRSVPVLNNILAYFLGLISFFAAHREPSLLVFAELSGAAAIGTLAGWLCHLGQARLYRAVRAAEP